MRVRSQSMSRNRLSLEMRRFRGCILGSAAGDALGAPVEDMTRRQITGQFGRVTNYVDNPRKSVRPGEWTDDTALTWATMSAIVDGGEVDAKNISSAMRMMFDLHPDRGYGLTTRRALSGEKDRHLRPANGAAMRIAPVALFSCLDVETMRTQVIDISRITHRHRDSIDGALAIAFAIASAARAELQPNRIILETIRFLGATTEMSYKLQEVQDLLDNEAISTEQALAHIGTRRNVLESVGSAFYAFLKSPDDFYRSVTEAVNAGGDTDTIASLTGALSGAYNGLEGIPRKWVNNLEAKPAIDEYSQRLYESAMLQIA
ncbi:MAG: ADP-ribosylglycohydrolase family protein [Candidatus Margulisiibacteriota bacterium]|nr:ADP-ribosylglycohydrolase family protein [Candidatus Margulisiibacteriota bacterium]